MAVPVRAELIAQVDSLGAARLHGWMQGQQHRRTELRGLARALPDAAASDATSASAATQPPRRRSGGSGGSGQGSLFG
jgi:hypothetical protein